MLRTIICTFFLIILAWSGAASAALDILEEVHEASVADTTLPQHTAGPLLVRGCDGCDNSILQVGAATRYFTDADAAPVSLAAFRAALSNEEHGLLYIFIEPGTSKVTRIVLDVAR